MEGPQFSTYAESMTYKQLGYSVIGMTNMPEAKLAREAEICYATVAMVTDFDCWHPEHDAVTVQDIIKVLLDECRESQAPGGAAGAGFSARARALSDRLRPRARHRADHRARGARPRTDQEARRGGGQGAAKLIRAMRSRYVYLPTVGQTGRYAAYEEPMHIVDLKQQPREEWRSGVTDAHESVGGQRRDAALHVRAMVRAGPRRADPSARGRGGAARARGQADVWIDDKHVTLTSGQLVIVPAGPQARLFQQRRSRRCTSSRHWPRRCSRRPMTTSARRRGAGCRGDQEL